MNLIYLVFGNDFRNHLQANFSIESFLISPVGVGHIYIITDLPEYFKSHDPSRVTAIRVNEALLKEWQQPHGFFWRIKIKAIQMLIEKYPGNHWLYLDSDTFLFGSLEPVIDTLDQGIAVMHLNEGRLSKLTSKTEKLMWLQCRNRSFKGIRISNDHCMWNAGAVGIPATGGSRLIADVLEFCDEMCAAPVTRRLIEQFAFSVILEDRTGLRDCRQVIGHYWGNKGQWNSMIRDFYARAQLSGMSMEERKAAFRNIDLRAFPVFVKTPNTQIKLINLVHKVFPTRDHRQLDQTSE